jgi:hypothetical protein
MQISESNSIFKWKLRHSQKENDITTLVYACQNNKPITTMSREMKTDELKVTNHYVLDSTYTCA